MAQQQQLQLAPASSLQPAMHAGDELHHLLTSGIACMRQGISLIEVAHCTHEACAAATEPPQPPEPWPSQQQQQQQQQRASGGLLALSPSHAPPRHSNSDPLNTSAAAAARDPLLSSGAAAATADDDDSGSVPDGATGAHVLRKRLGRVLYANAALEEMTGLRLHELQAHGLGAMFGPGTSHADIGALHAALRSRTPTTLKVLCYKRGAAANGGGGGGARAGGAPTSLTTTTTTVGGEEAGGGGAGGPIAGPSSLPSVASLAAAGCLWSSITVTPISQLPFTCTLWVPPHGPDGGGSGQHQHLASPGSGQALAPMSHSSSTQDVAAAAAGDVAPIAAAAGGADPRSAASLVTSALLGGGVSGVSAGAAGGGLGGGGSGCFVQYLLVHEDITERVTQGMQWRLRDHALSSCSEGITIADPSRPDAPLIYVNDAFLQITGYTREDVIGRNCRFLQVSVWCCVLLLWEGGGVVRDGGGGGGRSGCGRAPRRAARPGALDVALRGWSLARARTPACAGR